MAADTGHIATHESGAIEFGGHKVLTVPQKDGKISAQQIEKLVKDFYDDANYGKRGTAVPSFRQLHRSAKQVYPKKRSETAKTQDVYKRQPN